ncbi:MAG: heme-copper oxidase subunit III [Bacteriovoracaceae bacterium]
MNRRDVSHLPTHAFGSTNPLWWGNLAFMVIEGGTMVFAIATYIYFMVHNKSWPLEEAPKLEWATTLWIFLIVSEIPNIWVKKAAEKKDLKKVRKGLVIMAVIGFVAVALRCIEFTTLNTSWDHHSYGSIVWTLLGLHTFHIVTDWGETLVLTFAMFKGPIDQRRFPEIQDNQDYWHFVVFFWTLVYITIYWLPRWFEVKP